MNTYIITGANGFVGSRLIKKLSENTANQIICVVRSDKTDTTAFNRIGNIRIIVCPMEGYSSLQDKLSGINADFFIHLAWEGSTGSKRANHTIQLENVKNSIDAYNAAEKIGCKRFLCAGTVSENVLSQVNTVKSISQNMIYAQAKRSLYEFLCILSKQSKTEFVWMQFSNAYGPENRSGNLISYILSEIEQGRTPETGSGSQPYNFVYIDDLVNGVIALTEVELTKNMYFIGSDEVMLLREFLIQIPEIIGKDVRIGIGKKPDDGIIYKKEWFDISDLKNDTGYISKYPFSVGIQKTYNKR